MRPHIDLDTSLHEEVKEFADTHTEVATISEAYARLIADGLDGATTAPSPATDALPTTGTFRMTASTDESGINSMVLYTLVRAPTTPFATTVSRSDDLSKTSLRDMLYQLSELGKSTSYPSAVAALSQTGGEWVVGGAAAIFNALQTTQKRWDSQPKWNCHRKELVTIMAKLSDDYTAIVTGANTSEDGSQAGGLTDVRLTLLSDGHPVTGDTLANIASELGFPAPESGAPTAVESATLTNIETDTHRPVIITPSDIHSRITYNSPVRKSNDKWVSGAVVENPFTNAQLTRAARGVDVSQSLLDTVCDRDTVVVNFLDTHPVDDDTIDGYAVERLSIVDFSQLPGSVGSDVVNAIVDVRYRTDLS